MSFDGYSAETEPEAYARRWGQHCVSVARPDAAPSTVESPQDAASRSGSTPHRLFLRGAKALRILHRLLVPSASRSLSSPRRTSPVGACDLSTVGRPERSVMQRHTLQRASSRGLVGVQCRHLRLWLAQQFLPGNAAKPPMHAAASSATQRYFRKQRLSGYTRGRIGMSMQIMSAVSGNSYSENLKIPDETSRLSASIFAIYLPRWLSKLHGRASGPNSSKRSFFRWREFVYGTPCRLLHCIPIDGGKPFGV